MVPCVTACAWCSAARPGQTRLAGGATARKKDEWSTSVPVRWPPVVGCVSFRLRVLASMSSVASVLIFLLANAGDVVGGAVPQPESPPRSQPSRGLVIVLRPADVDELTRTALSRVTGELNAAEFQTTFITLDPAQDPTAQVETVAPESGAVAAFAIAHIGDPEGHTIAIWVSDRVGQRTSILRMAIQGEDISHDAAVLAVNAIELIRVSLAGLWPAPPAATTSKGDQAAKPSHRPQITLGLGISAQQDAGFQFPSLQVMGSMMAMVTWPRGLGLRAQVSGLGPALTLTEKYGTAQLRRELASLGLTWTFLRRPRLQSLVVASAGVAYLSGEGEAAQPTRAVAHSAAAWSALGSAGIAAAVRLVKGLWLAAELDGIATIPPLVIRIANADTKPFSRPGVLLDVGLHVTF
jgi:hypothetical protein